MGHHKHSDKTVCKYSLKHNRAGTVNKIFGRRTHGNGIIAFCSGLRAYPLGKRVHR
jgi:hypothetical protein